MFCNIDNIANIANVAKDKSVTNHFVKGMSATLPSCSATVPRSVIYVVGATVRSRMPSVALSASSGTIGHVPSPRFHCSSTADQS